MINFDTLQALAHLTRHDSRISFARSQAARESGDLWLAEMMEMDSKTASEDAAKLDHKLILILNHLEQIADLEQIERVHFDALNMDVPTDRLVLGRPWRHTPPHAPFQQEN